MSRLFSISLTSAYKAMTYRQTEKGHVRVTLLEATAAFVLNRRWTCKHTDTAPNCSKSHACPAADLLTWSHEPSSRSTSILHSCSDPYANTQRQTWAEIHAVCRTCIYSSRQCEIPASVHTICGVASWRGINSSKDVVCLEEKNDNIQTDELCDFLWHRVQKLVLSSKNPTDGAVSSHTKHEQWQATTEQPQGSSQEMNGVELTCVVCRCICTKKICNTTDLIGKRQSMFLPEKWLYLEKRVSSIWEVLWDNSYDYIHYT